MRRSWSTARVLARGAPQTVYGCVVVSRHVRFSLHDVTFAGIRLPGATVDCWDDASGRPWWQARVLTRALSRQSRRESSPATPPIGRALSGPARVADEQVDTGSRREVLLVLHGAGTLRGR